jgi:hypothetical protein
VPKTFLKCSPLTRLGPVAPAGTVVLLGLVADDFPDFTLAQHGRESLVTLRGPHAAQRVDCVAPCDLQAAKEEWEAARNGLKVGREEVMGIYWPNQCLGEVRGK